MGKKSKKPSHAAQPDPKKAPHSIEQPSGAKRPRSSGDFAVDNEQPVWLFQWVDNGGPWAWGNVASAIQQVTDRLGSYETKTWAEIKRNDGDGCHSIDVLDLPPASKTKVVNRLKEVGRSYIHSLFSLRIGAKARVWGHRAGGCFFVLWWDPDHTVYPVPKKHT